MRGWIIVIALAACSTKETTRPDDGGADASIGIDASMPNDPLVLDPEIQTLAPDANKIFASIQMLASFTTRNTCGTEIIMARDWILAQMKAIPGVMAMLAPYTHANCAGMPVRQNVVGWIPGTKNPERLVIIGGHYDSRTVDAFDGTSPAPGANDSGSQTSLVLEAARILAGKTYDATIVFVAFAGEEQPLHTAHSRLRHERPRFARHDRRVLRLGRRGRREGTRVALRVSGAPLRKRSLRRSLRRERHHDDEMIFSFPSWISSLWLPVR